MKSNETNHENRPHTDGVTQADLKALQQLRIEQAQYRQAESNLNMLRARDLARMLNERDC